MLKNVSENETLHLYFEKLVPLACFHNSFLEQQEQSTSCMRNTQHSTTTPALAGSPAAHQLSNSLCPTEHGSPWAAAGQAVLHQLHAAYCSSG